MYLPLFYKPSPLLFWNRMVSNAFCKTVMVSTLHVCMQAQSVSKYSTNAYLFCVLFVQTHDLKGFESICIVSLHHFGGKLECSYLKTNKLEYNWDCTNVACNYCERVVKFSESVAIGWTKNLARWTKTLMFWAPAIRHRFFALMLSGKRVSPAWNI